MNFQTMNKQRKFILIASAAGVLGMLLPWVSFGGFGSVNGLHGWGILMFLLFIASGAVTLMGNQLISLDKTYWFVALAAGGINAVFMIINFLRALDVLGAFSIGFYLTLVAAIAVVYFAWTLRSAGDDFKSGFNSFKDDVNKKVNNGNVG